MFLFFEREKNFSTGKIELNKYHIRFVNNQNIRTDTHSYIHNQLSLFWLVYVYFSTLISHAAEPRQLINFSFLFFLFRRARIFLTASGRNRDAVNRFFFVSMIRALDGIRRSLLKWENFFVFIFGCWQRNSLATQITRDFLSCQSLSYRFNPS